MPEILPFVMPLDMQAAALDTFNRYCFEVQEAEVIEAARWFACTIFTLIDRHAPFETFTSAETQNGNGHNVDADIHTDELANGFEDPNYNTKFVLTLSNVACASTIFFPDITTTEKLNGEHSHDYFERTQSGILQPVADTEGLIGKSLQGLNGQLAKFNTHTDFHAAAPLPNGAKKILFTLRTKT